MSQTPTIDNFLKIPINEELDNVVIEKAASHNADSINNFISLLRPLLDIDGVTELVINDIKEAWVEVNGKWQRYYNDKITFDYLILLTNAISVYSGQDLKPENPICSATLPTDERVQILLPPATSKGKISITIRKPSKFLKQIDDYKKEGFFNNMIIKKVSSVDENQYLHELVDKKEYSIFLEKIIATNKNIVVIGETGSGKTTFMKSIIQLIPISERLITIEDVPELFLPMHKNKVHLFYPSELKTGDVVSPTALLKSCMRMKPSRILLAELRGGEAFDWLNVVSSGHGGSITSCHAGSCELAFERLAMMTMQSNTAQAMSYEVIMKMLKNLIDIIIHVVNDAEGRRIKEVWIKNTLEK